MRQIYWNAIADPYESEYDKYLRSPEWKKRAEKRKIIDGERCVCCKRTEPTVTLNVHHRNYDNLGHEDIMNDLVTLCKDCHKKLHEKINVARIKNKETKEASFKHYELHLRDFYELHKHLDYAMGGNVNFLNINALKEYVPKWLEERGIEQSGGYIERVKAHFIKLRHNKIDELLAEEPGLTIFEIETITNFNREFIVKHLKRKGE